MSVPASYRLKVSLRFCSASSWCSRAGYPRSSTARVETREAVRAFEGRGAKIDFDDREENAPLVVRWLSPYIDRCYFSDVIGIHAWYLEITDDDWGRLRVFGRLRKLAHLRHSCNSFGASRDWGTR